MVDPIDIGAAFSGIGSGMIPNIMNWIGIILISALILGGFYVLLMFFQYNILIYKLKLGESRAEDGKKKYYIKGIKAMRAKRIKRGGVDRFAYMFKRLITDPVPERFITPYYGTLVKNAAFVYDIGGNVQIPSAINFGINSPATVNLTPLSFDIKRAASLQLHEIAKEYQEDTFMAKYGSFFWGAVTIIGCLVLVGLTVYLTYQYNLGYAQHLGQATEAAETLAESMKKGLLERFAGG